MTVLEIAEISKTKSKVLLDTNVCFALYRSEIRKYRIEKDAEISQECYDTIMNEVLLKRAKLRCMNLLKSRDYTEYQLRMKLRQGVYPEEIIEAAVAYVSSYGYVNDFRYAQTYIEYAGKSKSRRQIENCLAGKGVSRDTIEQAYEQCSEEDSITTEEELIYRLFEKKHFDRANATYEECQKMIGFLYRKGFVLDKIYKAVGRCDSGCE
ncbi:MAG: recombination regulator RecX [Lachnospiraceae bacterium]|nr:recombination regulator RecX [Lachnospiraceae bacterium]